MTDAQAAIIEAFGRLNGSYTAVAKELGLARGTVYNTVKRWQEKMLRKGLVPEGYRIGSFTTIENKDGSTRSSQKVVREGGDRDDFPYVPDPKAIKFTTTNLDSSMRVTSQWVREEKEAKEKAKLWADYAGELVRPIKAEHLIDELPRHLWRDPASDLCAVYPIGDYHVGMLAWGLETRSDNYDLKVSEQLIARAAEHLMKGAPPSKQCVLAFMGDFVHFDGMRPETPKSKNLVDPDSRFGKVGKIAVRIIRHLIAAAKRYHENVHVIFLDGNHDPSVATLINVFLSEMYADDPNVTVDDSPSNIRYYQWGNNLWGFTHGDKIKPENTPLILAQDMRKAWGETEHTVIFTGHVHNKSLMDKTGVFVETVPVIIPNDAFAAGAGYRSKRLMQVIIFDREFGEDQRHTFNADRFYRSIQ